METVFTNQQRIVKVKAFESCMRYLFAASAININETNSEKPEDSKPVNLKVIEFLKKLTRHFVLLFIIKGDT